MLARKLVSNPFRWTILTVALVGVITPTFAQQRKGKTVGELLKGIEKRAQQVNLQKGQSALPTFNKIGAPSTINLQSVKPPASSKLYYEEGTNEAELERVTDQGIDQLYKLTTQFKRSSKRGELWLRLAEQYVEKARLIEYQIQQKYDEDLVAARKANSKRAPKLNLKPAQEYNKKAIELYEAFLKDFPKDEKVPQALFFLGYNYFELNQTQKGEQFYQKLTKEYPQSPYVDQSHFALGEYYFENEKWELALQHYLNVTRNKRGQLYSFAWYKTAWCQYKIGQLQEALTSLRRVISAGRQAKGQKDDSSGGVSRIRLATEAVKDLVIFYAEVGKPEDAKSYFSKVAGPKAVFGLLEKLAYYYSDTGNRNGARYVFGELIEIRPDAPKAYDYQYQIVTMYVASGDSKVFRQELYRWIEGYGPDSIWAKANAGNAELLGKANQLIETTLRNYILQEHQTAQNSRAEFSQKMAKSGYELYFQTFKASSRLDEMHFFYAELLFDMQDWERAAFHYLWVNENAKNSQYYEKATLNALLALEKNLPSSEDVKKIVGQSTEPVEFDKTIRVFEKVALIYIKDFPKGESNVAIQYKIASLYYYYNQFDRALVLFNEIIEKHPKTKYAEYSANLILDIYNIRKDFAGLKVAGAKILAIPQLAVSPIGAEVKKVLERASFTEAQELEKSNDFVKSAESYQVFAKQNPGSELAVNAYFNAAINFEKGGDLFRAISMYAIVSGLKTEKNAGLKKRSDRILASLYEKTGQYAKAADAFETYANRNQKDKEAVAFYFNAGVIRDGMKFYTAAVRNYEKFFELSKGVERKEALFLIARIWERRQNYNQAAKFYEQYIDSNPSNAANVVEAAFKLAQINELRNRQKPADEWYQKTVSIQRRLSQGGKLVGVSHAAEARFKIVYKTYDELRQIKIPQNPAAQQKAVDTKLALINRLKEELKSVIKYDDGFQIVAALTLIGQAYQHMSAAIFNAPLPKGLDEESMKQYRQGIAQVAQPFQQQAIDNYLAALERSEKLEAYNEWAKVARKELHSIDSAKYKNFDSEVFVTKLPDWKDI
jgi:tetratricopeptide (TPR) repeat protein